MWHTGRHRWGCPRDARTLSRFQGNTPPLPEDKDEKHGDWKQRSCDKTGSAEKKYFLHHEFRILLWFMLSPNLPTSSKKVQLLTQYIHGSFPKSLVIFFLGGMTVRKTSLCGILWPAVVCALQQNGCCHLLYVFLRSKTHTKGSKYFFKRCMQIKFNACN